MSWHGYYRAIDAESPVLPGLREDRAFHTLLADLTTLGPGPFAFDALDRGEVDEALRTLVEGGLCPTLAAAEATLAAVLGEIERAVAADPGLADRAVYLEQCRDELLDALRNEAARRGSPDGTALVESLILGETPLESRGAWGGFRLVTPATVRSGAGLLGRMPAGVLPPGPAPDDPELAADLSRWRRLYLEAADQGRAVLVLTA